MSHRLVGDQQGTIPTVVLGYGRVDDVVNHVNPRTPLPVTNMPSQDAGALPLGYQRVTGLGQPSHLTPPAGSLYAVIQVEGGPVRWRDDGTMPTATTGMRLDVSGEMTYDSALTGIWFVQESAAAMLNVSFYGFTDA